jgi:hypothetical protein
MDIKSAFLNGDL